MRRLPLTAALSAVLAVCHTAAYAQAAATPASTTDSAHRTSAQINASDFAQQVKTLSSDAFEGRAPGGKGEQMTTDYLIAQFKQAGLTPGNHGEWLQAVPYVKSTLQRSADTALAIDGAKGLSRLAFGSQMVVGSLVPQAQAAIKDSPIVFIGYGVDAPDEQWNDYAGLDLKGKMVVILVNDPGWGNHDPKLFKGRALTYYGRWTYKFEEAARKGAAAAFIVHDTEAAGYPWGVVQNGWSGSQFSLPASEDPAPRLAVAGWLTTEGARELFKDAGADFDALKRSADQRGFKPVPLQARASIAIDSKIEQGQSHNVVAEVKGGARADEAIVYSAHWDHLGKQGDAIYHGAIDNATGVAGLLEIGAQFAQRKPQPARSVLFVAVTMEESGLLGSAYYVTHPAVPLAKTVANINMDALPIMGPSRDIAVLGYGQSQLDDYISAVARQQGRSISQDDKPEKGFFFRSDQLNFAKLGVPVLYARSGIDLVEGGKDAGSKASDDYTANRYHKPTDAYDPKWDLRGVIADLQALYQVGNKLADESTFPRWKTGSDFKRPTSTAP
jgi:Zn-dependent M28 family amino/carboxypeptidase